MKSGSLNLLEPSGPVQTTFKFYLFYYLFKPLYFANKNCIYALRNVNKDFKMCGKNVIISEMALIDCLSKRELVHYLWGMSELLNFTEMNGLNQ